MMSSDNTPPEQSAEDERFLAYRKGYARKCRSGPAWMRSVLGRYVEVDQSASDDSTKKGDHLRLNPKTGV